MSLKRGISIRHKKETERSVIKRTNIADDTLFYALFDDVNVRKLLRYDHCKVYTDNYSLANVAVFLERLKEPSLYMKHVLYQLLHIVGELNNDHELHTTVGQWALQENCQNKQMLVEFLREKDELLERLEKMRPVRYIELVKVMERRPDHFIWRRKRNAVHRSMSMIGDIRKGI